MALKITDADSTFPGLAPNHIPFESIVYQGPVGNTHTLLLYPGWNYISTFLSVASFNSDSTGGATANALNIINAFNTQQNQGVALQANDYSNDNPDYPYIVIFKDNAGSAVLPEYQFNGVGNLLDGQGYILKLITPSSYTQTTPLTLSGTLQQYSAAGINQVITISLASGWNLIAMPLTAAVDVSIIFADLVADNKVAIVKDYLGSVYYPAFNYNGIGDMLPGQAYQVNVTSSATLSFNNDLLIGNVSDPVIVDDDETVVVDPGTIQSNFTIFIQDTKVETFFNGLNEDVQITNIRDQILNNNDIIFSVTEISDLRDRLGIITFFSNITSYVYSKGKEGLLSKINVSEYIKDFLYKIQSDFELALYGTSPIDPLKIPKFIIPRDFRLQVINPNNQIVASSRIINRGLVKFENVSLGVSFVASKTLTLRLLDRYNNITYNLTTTGDAVTAAVDAIVIINSLSLANGVQYGTEKIDK